MSNKFIVTFGNDIKIFDITKHEKKALLNALSDKQETLPFFKIMAEVLRNNNVQSIYSIESDGTEQDLIKFYYKDPKGFIHDVEKVGEKIFSR